MSGVTIDAVYTTKPNKRGKKRRPMGYTLRFHYPNDDSPRWRVRLLGDSPDVKAAERARDNASALIGRLAQRMDAGEDLGRWLADMPDKQHARFAKTGLVEPRDPSAVKAKTNTLDEHVADWQAWREASTENTAEHDKRTMHTLKRLLDDAQITTLQGITDMVIGLTLKAKKRSGVSHRTCNKMLGTIKAFTAWAYVSKRLPEDPLSERERYNEEKDRRVDRRALADDEFDRLVASAEGGPDRVNIGQKCDGFPRWIKILGAERAMLYRVAAGTGLRANEIRTLSRASLDLIEGDPGIHVTAKHAKGNRYDRLSISDDLAARLREWLKKRPAGKPVFTVPDKTAAILRADLRFARALWIKEATDPTERRERHAGDYLRAKDSAGRLVDFHALRVYFITGFARRNVSMKTAQVMARHSDINLTAGIYSKVGDPEKRAAIEKAHGRPATSPELRLTGTDSA